MLLNCGICYVSYSYSSKSGNLLKSSLEHRFAYEMLVLRRQIMESHKSTFVPARSAEQELRQVRLATIRVCRC